MSSTPITKSAGTAPGAAPRPPRGFITSFGVGRVCATRSCGTALSRYNSSELCWQHAHLIEERHEVLS